MLVGEVQIASGGVLHGWCWDPKEPNKRQTLDLTINDKVVATVVTSRFREDLRDKGIGDGYHGFMLTLTKSINDAGNAFVIAAKGRPSGELIWQQVRGPAGLPLNFESRTSRVSGLLRQISRSKLVFAPDSDPFHNWIHADLGILGNLLTKTSQLGGNKPAVVGAARSALLKEMPISSIPEFASSRVCIVVVVDLPGLEVLRTLVAAIPHFHQVNASLLVIDRGADEHVALFPSLFPNLRYVFEQSDSLTIFLEEITKLSQSEFLICIRNPSEPIGLGLAELLEELENSNALFVRQDCALLANRLAHRAGQASEECTANVYPGVRFAARRKLLNRLANIEFRSLNLPGLSDVDLALRGLRGGFELRGLRGGKRTSGNAEM